MQDDASAMQDAVGALKPFRDFAGANGYYADVFPKIQKASLPRRHVNPAARLLRDRRVSDPVLDRPPRRDHVSARRGRRADRQAHAAERGCPAGQPQYVHLAVDRRRHRLPDGVLRLPVRRHHQLPARDAERHHVGLRGHPLADRPPSCLRRGEWPAFGWPRSSAPRWSTWRSSGSGRRPWTPCRWWWRLRSSASWSGCRSASGWASRDVACSKPDWKATLVQIDKDSCRAHPGIASHSRFWHIGGRGRTCGWQG